MITLFRAHQMPQVFVPTSGLTGLLEKRVQLYTPLELGAAASFIGDFQHSADSDIYLDDAADWHNNHANDPGGSALSLADGAGFNWERSRGISGDLTLSHKVHIVLDGYHPGGGGTDNTSHTLTAGETVNAGMAVYVPSSNTVNLSTANSAGSIESFPVGLANGNATVGNEVEVLCEGSVYLPDWTAVIGTANLTVGSWYFLSDTSGKLTTTAPSTANHTIIRVGRAITTTLFDIEISDGIVL
jgi:hypothetical protein